MTLFTPERTASPSIVEVEVESPHYTLETFRALVESPAYAHKELELWEGEIIEVSKPNPLHHRVVLLLVHQLMLYLDQQPHLGEVFGDNTEFAPSDEVLVVPDAAFIRAAKIRLPYPQSFPFVPDIAVEVISPSNRHDEMLAQVELYLRYGSEQVWLLYPEERSLHIYTGVAGDLRLRRLSAQDTLTAETLLPGLRLKVAQCFPPLPAPSQE
jgi:Uma2 family endonuclease